MGSFWLEITKTHVSVIYIDQWLKTCLTSWPGTIETRRSYFDSVDDGVVVHGVRDQEVVFGFEARRTVGQLTKQVSCQLDWSSKPRADGPTYSRQ